MTYRTNEKDEVVSLSFRREEHRGVVTSSVCSQAYFAISKIPQFRKVVETGTTEDCWDFINRITPFLATLPIDRTKLRLMLIDLKHEYDSRGGVTA